MTSSKVCVIYTGGTLGMVPSDPSDPRSPLTPGDKGRLARYLPAGLAEVTRVQVDLVDLTDLHGNPVVPVDSSDVDIAHWQYMANAVASRYDDYDGFVLLHGTDTMAYTASALSFMLRGLAKPVVLTGSQLPMANPRTDAVSNMVNAVLVAAPQAAGLPVLHEVVIVFASAILRGNRSRKMSSTAWQGFDSPNFGHLGSIGEHIRIDAARIGDGPGAGTPLELMLAMDNRVADVNLFPGIDPAHIDLLISHPQVRGVVLRTFGAGNAPNNAELVDVIGRAVDAGTTIVNVTQCPEGMVEPGRYATSSALSEAGVVPGLDLTPEAALTKLMSLLSNCEPGDVSGLMTVPIAGEITPGPPA